MKSYFIAGLLISVTALAVYSLDRGIYIGTRYAFRVAPCCIESGEIQKRCRYLFVTGISEIDARDGRATLSKIFVHFEQAGFSRTEITEWLTQQSAERLVRIRPDLDNGYCHLFGE